MVQYLTDTVARTERNVDKNEKNTEDTTKRLEETTTTKRLDTLIEQMEKMAHNFDLLKEEQGMILTRHDTINTTRRDCNT